MTLLPQEPGGNLVPSKSKRLRAGTRLRVTEAGEHILLTPVYAPSEEELVAVSETAGGPGPEETR